MIFLLATEAMFFAGLISAYIVNRSSAVVWLTYGQPRLPIEITAFNTVILISSAISIFIFSRKYVTNYYLLKGSRKLLGITILLGGIFIAIQGSEWIKLINYGLTTTSSLYGAFFYLIIGAHAVHAIAGLLILIYLYFTLNSARPLNFLKDKITICSMYWYFVVGIWPLLYTLVYLI